MIVADLEPIQRLTRDVRQALHTLSPQEARYLVDTYYQLQEYRIAAASQVREMSKTGEPADVLAWLFDQMETLENQIKSALDKWTDSEPMGMWAKSVYGIGPVIAAGLLAHIDITKAPTVGHIWRFAGLDPTTKWNKKEKRPWNADLKVLTWKVGQSFMKFSLRDECFYGHVYRERKALEIARNEAGQFAEQAARILTERRIGTETDAFKHYSGGKLPPAHIDARARRYAVKLFLSHYHHRAYEAHYGTPPPLPYPIAHQGHAHTIPPPA